jgi:hypothetical protein
MTAATALSRQRDIIVPEPVFRIRMEMASAIPSRWWVVKITRRAISTPWRLTQVLAHFPPRVTIVQALVSRIRTAMESATHLKSWDVKTQPPATTMQRPQIPDLVPSHLQDTIALAFVCKTPMEMAFAIPSK